MLTLHVKDFFKKRFHLGAPPFAKSSLKHCLFYLSPLFIFKSPQIAFTIKLFTQSLQNNTSSKFCFSFLSKTFQSSLTFPPQ